MSFGRNPLPNTHPRNGCKTPLQESLVVLLFRLPVSLLSQADMQLSCRNESHNGVLVPSEELAIQTQEIEGLQQPLDLAAPSKLVGFGSYIAPHLLQGIYDGGPKRKKRVILVRVVDEGAMSCHGSSILLRNGDKLCAAGNRKLLFSSSFHSEATKHEAVKSVVRRILGLLRSQLGRGPVRAPDRSLLFHENVQVGRHCLH
mmetsp:Transcript_46629/g.101317  ORF Transcript_46629/g.101317 Transcript_46629/m.101317 type:complete len:201 (-) Transcript_46629:560-1162(-)